MDLTQSIGNAQNSAACQFCEVSPEIRWKCINCDLLLCQLCNSKIHSKIKSSTEHQIMNLKECGTENAAESIRKLGLKTINCQTHTDQTCSVYCNDCDQAICLRCLIQSHKQHALTELEEVYRIRNDEMKDLKNKLDSAIPIFETGENKLLQMLSDGDKQFQEYKTKILEQEEEIKKAVKKHSQELVMEMESKWRTSKEMINKEISVMRQNKDDLQNRKQQVDQALQSHQAADILATNSLNKTLAIPKMPVNTIQLENTKFIPGKILFISRSKAFGDLCRVPDLQHMKIYQTDMNRIDTGIIYNNNSMAFIGSYPQSTLQKVSLGKESIKVESEVKIVIYDMVMLKNGELLISSGEDILKLFSQNEQVQILQSFYPLKTLGIHINEQNEIVVGLTESFPFNIPTTDSIRQIVVLNTDGNIKHTYEFNEDNQRLFTWPRRVTSYYNNICVVDIIDETGKGRIVAINSAGQLQWTYSGCDTINSNQCKFTPTDITVTSADMMLISDRCNHTIHILNFKGEVIICKEVKDMGIQFPISLHIDKSGMLWIGENVGNKNGEKAKIHAIKLT